MYVPFLWLTAILTYGVLCVRSLWTLKLQDKVFTLISSNQLLIHDVKFHFNYQFSFQACFPQFAYRFSNPLLFKLRSEGSVFLSLPLIRALANSNKHYSHWHWDIFVILIWQPRLTLSHPEVTAALFLTQNQFSGKIISKVFFFSFFYQAWSRPADN